MKDLNKTGNVRLALAIRKVHELREASYDASAGRCGGYSKRYQDCIREVVGDDPIATILSCLFTAGYCDMYEFADAVLGKVELSGVAASKEGEGNA